MRPGLTLGKYAPFHHGHHYVITRALEEVEKLIVLVYDAPSTTDIPVSVRAEWVSKIFPKVEVLIGYGSPEVTGMDRKIQRIHEEYIKSMLGGRRIEAFFSSEPYGEHVSRALNCQNYLVDEARSFVPVTATMIRENPFQYRSYLNPIVYRSFVKNVVFLGAPSTGKSTLVEALAKEYDTIFMPEYGREYWDEHQQDKRLTLDDLNTIAKVHIEREDARIYNANKYMFTDTNAITTYLFSMYYHGYADQFLWYLADECYKRYDVVFLCDEDIPYDDTWDRSGEANRHMFQRMYYDYLAVHKIPFTLLSGNLEARMKKVKDVLDNSL